jgi:hypothetical protein
VIRREAGGLTPPASFFLGAWLSAAMLQQHVTDPSFGLATIPPFPAAAVFGAITRQSAGHISSFSS